LGCVGVALLLASPTGAQGTGAVVGTVFDAETGKPLPFASVGVVDTTLGQNTGTDGRFVIDALPAGTHKLRVSYIGYETREVSVTVQAFQPTRVRIRLNPKQAAGQTREVLVTAERPLVDVSEISTVRETSAEDIAKLTVDENLQVITGGYEAEHGQAISGIVNVRLKEGGDARRTSVEYHTGNFDTQRAFIQTEGPLLPIDGSYPIPGKMSYLFGIDMLASDTYLPSLRESTNFGFGQRRSLRSGYVNHFAGLQWSYDDFLRPRQDNSMNLYTKITWQLSPRNKVNTTFTKYVGLDHAFFRFRVGDENADASNTNTRYPYEFRDQLDQYPTTTEETSSQVVTWRWAMRDNAYSSLTFSRFYNSTEEAVQGKRPWEEGQEYDEWVETPDVFFVTDENGDFPKYRNVFVDRYSLSGTYTHRWQEHNEFKGGFESNYYTVQMIDITNPREGEGGLGSVRDMYRVNPNDGAFFVQNSFSYEGFVGHAGIRGDYLFLGEAADEAAAGQEAIADDYLRDTNSLFGNRYKLFWSPRLAINHPITDRSSIHFNFGHFTQWPRLVYYYAKISSRSSEAFPLEGNLNLDPERSVQFEFGVKQQFTDHDAVDITLFNKDTYDYPVATRTFEATRNRLVYVNSDFSRTRGIEFAYRHSGGRRISGDLSYEFQIATGKPANPNRIKQVDPEALETGEAEPELNEEFMPWNRPHRVQASFNLFFRRGDRPNLWGMGLPDQWGLNFFYTLRSGKPYTPTDIRGQTTGKRYSENAPTENVLDMKFNKTWDVGGRDGTILGLVLELRNVFGTTLRRVVDSNTGTTPVFGEGTHTLLAPGSTEGVVRQSLENPAFFGEGRNFRLGLEVTF
jgi:outer membrane receptor protein involved in Fe transport